MDPYDALATTSCYYQSSYLTPPPSTQQNSCFDNSTTNMSTFELVPLSRRRRRQRTVFSKEQLDILDDIFLKNAYPDIVLREELSDKLEVPESRIQIWFKNRRSRCRITKKIKN